VEQNDECVHDEPLEPHEFEENEHGHMWCCDLDRDDPIHDVAGALALREVMQAYATTIPLGLVA